MRTFVQGYVGLRLGFRLMCRNANPREADLSAMGRNRMCMHVHPCVSAIVRFTAIDASSLAYRHVTDSATNDLTARNTVAYRLPIIGDTRRTAYFALFESSSANHYSN